MKLPIHTPCEADRVGTGEWTAATQPIDEPGSPIPVPDSWRRRSADLYRDLECPRQAACARVAMRSRWPAWGCHGCEHAADPDLLEPSKSKPSKNLRCASCGRPKPTAEPMCGPCVDMRAARAEAPAKPCKWCSEPLTGLHPNNAYHPECRKAANAHKERNRYRRRANAIHDAVVERLIAGGGDGG